MSDTESAWVVGHITVKDAAKWAEYRSKVPATLAPWTAELILRGRRTTVLSGQHDHADIVIIRFPNPAAVDNWYRSAAYQALIPLREAAADIDLVTFAST